METTEKPEEVKKLEQELKESLDILKRTHVFFKKPFNLYYYARIDGNPMAPSNIAERDKLFKADQEKRAKGETIDIEIKSVEIKEGVQLADLKMSRNRGEIRFVPEMEWQLLMELFDQAGLTTTVVDPKPEPATADA